MMASLSQTKVITSVEDMIECYGQPMTDEQLKQMAIAYEYQQRLENSIYVVRVEE